MYILYQKISKKSTKKREKIKKIFYNICIDYEMRFLSYDNCL